MNEWSRSQQARGRAYLSLGVVWFFFLLFFFFFFQGEHRASKSQSRYVCWYFFWDAFPHPDRGSKDEGSVWAHGPSNFTWLTDRFSFIISFPVNQTTLKMMEDCPIIYAPNKIKTMSCHQTATMWNISQVNPNNSAPWLCLLPFGFQRWRVVSSSLTRQLAENPSLNSRCVHCTYDCCINLNPLSLAAVGPQLDVSASAVSLFPFCCLTVSRLPPSTTFNEACCPL